MRRRWMWCPAAALALWFAPAVCADEPDEPGRGVARISVINGDVSVRRGDSGDWVAAAPNAPLVVQDHVLTGANSRAEVQFDYANFARLAANSELRLSELENRRYQMQLAQGTLSFRVLRDSDADVEVSTPAVSVRPQKKGLYRVSVRDDGETEITVRSGEVEVYTPRGVERLRAGKTMLARSVASEIEFQLISEIPEDDFDRWNEGRDRDLQRSRSYQYVSRDVYGAEDLDPYGSWVSVDTYGWVWRPHVHVGWAPYRYGRWAWVDWYGWTWVSSDPWGWAPYHYGRWFHHGHHGWLWHPGGLHRRHYWSPALVAFFGIGSVSVGVGFGRVGWVPLAPYEPYYPWYGRRYYGGYRSGYYGHNNVQIINNINVTRIYRNSRVSNGITAWEGSDFARGRSRDYIRVNERDIRDVRLVRGQVPVAPDRDSIRFSDRDVRGDSRAFTRASAADPGRFYSRRQPAAVERVPFEEQRRGLERLSRGERTVADVRGREASDRPGPEAGGSSPERRIAASDAPGQMQKTSAGDSRGWRRFGEPEGSAAAARSRRESRSEAGSSQGWRTFGDPASAPARSAENGQSRRESEQGWRRLGQPSTAVDNPSTRPAENRTTRREGEDGWQRFGQQRRETREAPAVEQGNRLDSGAGRESGTNRESSWTRFGNSRQDRGEGRSEIRTEPEGRQRPSQSPGETRQDRSQFQDNIRLSSPVVRERPSRTDRQENGRISRGESRFGRESSGRSGGSVMQSTPRMESGESSGRGGGGSRMSGGGSFGRSGGGGSARSSGGGGGRSGGGGGGGRSGGGGRQR